MVHALAYYNGEILPADEIRLSPFQTGLLTGWGLFSTLRIYRGVPFAIEDHMARLAADAARLRIDLGDLLDHIPAALRGLVERNRALESMARVYCIRNRGGLLDTPGRRPTDLLVFSAELRDWGSAARLRIQPHGRHAQAPLAATKTLTWSHNLVLLEAANQAGFDDVLLLNERGEVSECTAANIFAVREGRLETPPLASSGALPGISRRHLLAACARAGRPVVERVLLPHDLFSADEVFICSTTREVQAVVRLDDRDVSGPGPVTAACARLFRQEVDRYVEARLASPSLRA